MKRGDVVLRVADLRRACVLLLDEVEQRFGEQVALADVPVDYYWNLPLSAAFGMGRVPQEDDLDCGTGSDDVAEIAGLVEGGREEVVLWHDLDHLAGVLRLLAFLDLPAEPQVNGSGQPD